MLKYILDIILFAIGIFLGITWFSVIILPLFYGIPRSTYYAIKGKLRATSILLYFGTFLLWTIIFLVAATILVKTFPNYEKYMSITFIFGQWLGIIISVYRTFFSNSGRDDLNKDFWDTREKYKI